MSFLDEMPKELKSPSLTFASRGIEVVLASVASKYLLCQDLRIFVLLGEVGSGCTTWLKSIAFASQVIERR